jgi:hypothetical protein
MAKLTSRNGSDPFRRNSGLEIENEDRERDSLLALQFCKKENKMWKSVCTFIIALVISTSLSNMSTPPSAEEQLRERCGVPANIDAYATCLASKHNEDRERDSLLALTYLTL